MKTVYFALFATILLGIAFLTPKSPEVWTVNPRTVPEVLETRVVILSQGVWIQCWLVSERLPVIVLDGQESRSWVVYQQDGKTLAGTCTKVWMYKVATSTGTINKR